MSDINYYLENIEKALNNGYSKKELKKLVKLAEHEINAEKKNVESVKNNLDNYLTNDNALASILNYFRIDFNKIENKLINGNYGPIEILKTDGYLEYIDYDGHGRDFSWWTEYYKLNYVTLIFDKTIDTKKVYSLYELNDLAKNNKIMLISINSLKKDKCKLSKEDYTRYKEYRDAKLYWNTLRDFIDICNNKQALNELNDKFGRGRFSLYKHILQDYITENLDSMYKFIENELVDLNNKEVDLKKIFEKYINSLSERILSIQEVVNGLKVNENSIEEENENN